MEEYALLCPVCDEPQQQTAALTAQNISALLKHVVQQHTLPQWKKEHGE